jgi:hypothetical protein
MFTPVECEIPKNYRLVTGMRKRVSTSMETASPMFRKSIKSLMLIRMETRTEI